MVNWTPELLSALVAAAVALAGAYATLRKAKSDATTLYHELCADQMARIEMLTARIIALEREKDELVKRYTAEIEALEGQLDDLREALAGKQQQIETLRSRVADLEAENARLKEELERICKERQQRTTPRR